MPVGDVPSPFASSLPHKTGVQTTAAEDPALPTSGGEIRVARRCIRFFLILFVQVDLEDFGSKLKLRILWSASGLSTTWLGAVGSAGASQDPRLDKWQWDVDKTRQYLDEQAK